MKFYKAMRVYRDEYERVLFLQSPAYSNSYFFPNESGKIILSSNYMPDSDNEFGIYVVFNKEELFDLYENCEICEIVPAKNTRVIIHEYGARLEKGIVTKISDNSFFVNTGFDLSKVETGYYDYIFVNGNLTIKKKDVIKINKTYISTRVGITPYKRILYEDNKFMILDGGRFYESIRFNSRIICLYDPIDKDVLYYHTIRHLFPEMKVTKLPCKYFLYDFTNKFLKIYGARVSDFRKIRDGLNVNCMFFDSIFDY